MKSYHAYLPTQLSTMAATIPEVQLDISLAVGRDLTVDQQLNFIKRPWKPTTADYYPYSEHTIKSKKRGPEGEIITIVERICQSFPGWGYPNLKRVYFASHVCSLTDQRKSPKDKSKESLYWCR